MRNNGSDEPIFETDDARSYFLTILKARIDETVIDRFRPIMDDYGRLTDDYGRLSQDEEKIIRHLLEHKTITRKEVIELIEAQKTKAHEILSQMREKKIIITSGKGRSTHYILGELAHDQ